MSTGAHHSAAEAIAQGRGATAAAMRRDREAMFPSSSGPAKSAAKPPVRQASDNGLGPVPKGFDPYMMNGTGVVDSRDLENAKGIKLAWNCSLQ
jgi:hypothetical protein